MMMKILIADDHPLVREGIRNVLLGISAEQQTLEAAGFGEAKSIAEQQPELDLVILDLSMPEMNGVYSLREMRSLLPSTPIAVVSASEDLCDIRNAIDNGANGYIPKSSSNEIMRNAIQLILSGGLYLPPQWAKLQTPDRRNNNDTDNLTNRQLEILQLLSIGKANKEIARDLDISDKTVKAHLTDIFRRLHANNRTQAVHAAMTLGLLTNTRAS